MLSLSADCADWDSAAEGLSARWVTIRLVSWVGSMEAKVSRYEVKEEVKVVKLKDATMDDLSWRR
jgi:hypothetical protein